MIHSDFERGFIRAEVLSYERFDPLRSLANAREKGLLRLEGKDYIVQDGDIITFRLMFKVAKPERAKNFNAGCASPVLIYGPMALLELNIRIVHGR